jgi:hypothetical protein
MNQFIELESQMTIVKSLLKEMKEAMEKGLKINNHVIFGDRGVGKSTLLKLLYREVIEDEKLNEAYHFIFVPSSFHGVGGSKEIERLVASISVKDVTKHHILVIDDLDFLLSDSEIDAHSLREMLIRDDPRLTLVATAHSSLADRLGASKALYGFFSQHTLEVATDNDVFALLDGMLKTDSWTKLNRELTLTSTFWIATIAENNLRLLTILINVFYALSNRPNATDKQIDSEQFLTNYFEFAGPSFRNELMGLPRYSRYFLEEASFCGHYFKVREVSLDISNPSREATRLVQFGYLKKNLDGEYSFTNRPIKAWLRFMKQVPLGKVLNVDIPIERR